MDIKDYFASTFKALDEVSPSFCIAKWKNVTLHLHSGQTQSCHHPQPHAIPVEGLLQNPKILHNTPQKIQARKEMMTGIRPTECQYCWTVEDNSQDKISDRIVKSGSSWAADTKDEILKNPLGNQFNPSYLEVSFSNLCNLKCTYCGPHFSSSWANELEKYGDIPGFNFRNNSIPEKQNPYIESFWKWWPELKSSLRVLRLTGGEPFLSETVMSLLNELLIGEPLNLKLIINSNLSIPEHRMDAVLELLKSLHEKKKVTQITLVTSLESAGVKAEYIRNGLRTTLFWKNLQKIRELDFCEVSITATVNVLVMGSFQQFYQDVADFKRQTKKSGNQRLMIDPTFLKEPVYFNILNFPKPIKVRLLDEIQEILKMEKEFELHSYEIMRLKTIHEVIQSKLDTTDLSAVQRLEPLLNELDRRRQLNHREVFPELFFLLDQFKNQPTL